MGHRGGGGLLSKLRVGLDGGVERSQFREAVQNVRLLPRAYSALLREYRGCPE
jgi:hypothetical protein